MPANDSSPLVCHASRARSQHGPCPPERFSGYEAAGGVQAAALAMDSTRMAMAGNARAVVYAGRLNKAAEIQQARTSERAEPKYKIASLTGASRMRVACRTCVWPRPQATYMVKIRRRQIPCRWPFSAKALQLLRLPFVACSNFLSVCRLPHSWIMQMVLSDLWDL